MRNLHFLGTSSVALVLAVFVTAAGCGSSDSGSPDDSATGPTGTGGAAGSGTGGTGTGGNAGTGTGGSSAGGSSAGGKGGATGTGGAGGAATGGSGGKAAGGAAAGGNSAGGSGGSGGDAAGGNGTGGGEAGAGGDSAGGAGGDSAGGSGGDNAGGAGGDSAGGAGGDSAGGSGGSGGGSICTGSDAQLTVLNVSAWCDVTVGTLPVFSDVGGPLCLPPGTVDVSAVAQSGFQLGTAPWHHTDGDTGTGEQGTITGTGQTASSAAKVTFSASGKCVWVCCEFSGGGGCPGPTDPDPCAGM